MDLAIVVVTHDSSAMLGRCLAALGPLAEHVIVADNASGDGTVALARAAGVKVLAHDENLGFARAANAAAATAAARCLCFLNPDCEVTPALVEHAVAALEGHPDRCVVPTLLEADGRRVDGRQPGYTRLKLWVDVLESTYGVSAFSRWLRRQRRYHDAGWAWPHGACLFIGRDLFDAVGGFDPRFFLYMEDVELGRRITARGGEVVQLDGVVRHVGAGGAAVTALRRRMLLTRGRLRYARARHGLLFAGLLAAVALPGLALRRLLRRWP